MSGAYWLEHAVVDGALRTGVRVEHRDGAIAAVREVPGPRPGDLVLAGLALPGIANAHSHAFHRALRGRTHAEGGDFWAWRGAMYRAAAALDAPRLHALATAAYAEMLLAGYTAVGEFHYVHRAPDGTVLDPTTAMADALVQAASDAGIRLTLLDTLYRHGGRDARGVALAPEGAQTRFVDPDVDAWLERHRRIGEGGLVRRGAALHSVRAVDPEDAARVVAAIGAEPLHAHVSEQPAENAQSRAAFGRTPVAVLAEAGAVTERFTAVHATHLTDEDVAVLGAARATACLCPTTERDLADGIGRARDLADAGARLAIGSDQHAVVDPFDELRALEGHERLARGERGVLDPGELLAAATAHGYAALGWTGGLRAGAACDLVVLDPASPRTAGARPEQLWLAASAADVTDVVVGGEHVVAGGAHALGEVGRRLAAAIGEVLP